jgi:hypothetical protein
MTARDPDGPPQDELAFLYQYDTELPQEVDEWNAIYDGLIAQMKREASGTPMTTVQNLLIERIARSYVDLRRGEVGGMTIRDRKELTALWISMTTEFNKLLKLTEDQRLEDFKSASVDIFFGVLDSIEDPVTRRSLLLSTKEKFAALENN